MYFLFSLFFFLPFILDPPEITVERPVVFSGEGHEAMLVCIVHGETQPEVCFLRFLQISIIIILLRGKIQICKTLNAL